MATATSNMMVCQYDVLRAMQDGDAAVDAAGFARVGHVDPPAPIAGKTAEWDEEALRLAWLLEKAWRDEQEDV